ncbi:sulfurtransferase [Motiliproteus sp. MSK22-1]|uniref:sulfurtransferase n=1 Tax=Motiliproteus sp. MSK22-1 TaxID=1897630 RepID=UPI0009771EFC|nr:sulfurtransferase [Motiliproteus sp. MSK22-1]OMH38203.1 3-mercaptopyruvate sulfurtransferase [Motiliproteus sp. MSK22-1]
MNEYRTLVDTDTLEQNLDNPSWIVLDGRFDLMDTESGRNAYLESHIPGAQYVHLDEQLSSAITPDSGRHPLPRVEELAGWFSGIGINPGTQVVVYDSMGGAMAARCWWLLNMLGHTRVAVLDGGFPKWKQAGKRVSSSVGVSRATSVGAPTSIATESSGIQPYFSWNSDGVVNVDEVLENLDTEAFLLIDARSSERFRGEQEPIDPVAGHVPKALNRALQLNLQPDGCFKPATQLRQEWHLLLGAREPQQVVHMCGSGVTACHNQLSMERAGLTGSRIYAGSWSEWIRDFQRPIATV